MALRERFGYSSGDIMREDAMPCSKYVRALSGLAATFGGIIGMPLCRLQYGPRTTTARMLRWSAATAVGCASAMAIYSILWEPACEPQNVAAYDQ